EFAGPCCSDQINGADIVENRGYDLCLSSCQHVSPATACLYLTHLLEEQLWRCLPLMPCAARPAHLCVAELRPWALFLHLAYCVPGLFIGRQSTRGKLWSWGGLGLAPSCSAGLWGW